MDEALVPAVPELDRGLAQPPAEEHRLTLTLGGEVDQAGLRVPEQDSVLAQELHLPLQATPSAQHRRSRRPSPVVALGVTDLAQGLLVGGLAKPGQQGLQHLAQRRQQLVGLGHGVETLGFRHRPIVAVQVWSGTVSGEGGQNLAGEQLQMIEVCGVQHLQVDAIATQSAIVSYPLRDLGGGPGGPGLSQPLQVLT